MNTSTWAQAADAKLILDFLTWFEASHVPFDEIRFATEDDVKKYFRRENK